MGVYLYQKLRKTPKKQEDRKMKKFEVGKTYSMRSICNHECVWTYTVIARTAATITITDGKETKTCRINKVISSYDNKEAVLPLGRYSMCPILRAE